MARWLKGGATVEALMDSPPSLLLEYEAYISAENDPDVLDYWQEKSKVKARHDALRNKR